jgi:hypothetical protein
LGTLAQRLGGGAAAALAYEMRFGLGHVQSVLQIEQVG